MHLLMLANCHNHGDILNYTDKFLFFFSVLVLFPFICPICPRSFSPLTLSLFLHRYYMLPRPGIASPLPPLCTVTASAASSPPTRTCSTRSTCHPPYHCQMARNPHRIRGLAPCSSVTLSSKWSSTANR